MLRRVGREPVGRRGFLAGLLRSFAASAVWAPALRAVAAADRAPAAAGAGLSAAEWATVGTVFEHLLPSEPAAPGAREVNAAGYLRRTLADPRLDRATRALVRAGVVELDTMCTKHHGRGFVRLHAEQREAALRRMEAGPSGQVWLEQMLEFLLEALLCDPVYGGNPGGIGWKWLGVDPGFPTPSAR